MSNPTIAHVATVFPIDVEELKDGTNQQGCRSIIHEFALNTSTNGIPGIARSRSVHNRVFWSVSTLVFTGIMFYFVIQSIQAYFEYPTQTSVSIRFQWPQYFPAFSICNYSPFRYDHFIEALLNYTKTNDTNFISIYDMSVIREFLQYKINRNESLTDFMYPLSSMLIQCTYNGLTCTAADFITFMSPIYGLCYTFNAQVGNGSVRYLSENGGNGMLQLRLYAQSHQYVPFITDGVGMIGMIHDNTQLPLIDIGGLNLGPGQKHKLCFEKRTNIILPPPYTKCTDKVSLAMQAMFNNFDNADYAYSQLACLIVCIQAYVYQQCGCTNPLQWSARSIVLPGTNTMIDAPICNLSDPCYVKAADQLMSTPDIYNYFCLDCQQECSYTDYPVETSSVSAPPDWMSGDIKEFVENSSIPLPSDWSTSWYTYIQKNYVAVDIVQKSVLVENYTQQATLSPVDVLSNVGGQTGLWIGISFLSLMEVVEMLYRLIRYQSHLFRVAIRKKRRAKKRKFKLSNN